MNELAWLVGHRFRSLTKREFEWLFVFDNDVTLVAACLWRLLENGRIRFTSCDDGQAWNLSRRDQQFIAMGGGELAVYDDRPRTG